MFKEITALVVRYYYTLNKYILTTLFRVRYYNIAVGGKGQGGVDSS
jgi:hypothetical protein